VSELFKFSAIYQAYEKCLRGKRQTRNAQRYQIQLLDNLWQTLWQLQQYQWTLGHAIFFITLKPKVREIHAADFSERVVHHLLVPELESLFEPVFIYDCYSNRKDKGTHKAVKRLQGFMKSTLDKQGQAYYLQLDIKNFFNTIDKPILFKLVNYRLQKAIDQGKISQSKARDLSWCCKQLLKPRSSEYLIKKGPQSSFDQVPQHKRLNQATEKGLPIGNLTSQFFANVYLNELDQFIKHQLKCKAYVRYVDDSVLVHHDPLVLKYWQFKINQFCNTQLQLQLKPIEILNPVQNGVNFLGYITRPGYFLVRRRVIANLKEKLDFFQKQFIYQQNNHTLIHLQISVRDKCRATLSSYLGHFKHANCLSLISKIKKDYSWLEKLFIFKYKGHIAHQGVKLIPRWQPLSVSSLKSQWHYFKNQNIGLVIMQLGHVFELYNKDAHRLSQLLNRPLLAKEKINRYQVQACLRLHQYEIKPTLRYLRKKFIAYQLIVEQGYLPGGLKKRVLKQWFYATEPDYLKS